MAKTEFQQELSSASANAVYLLKTEDDIITGIVSLQNDVNVNKHLVNLQEHIYTVGDIIGIVGENDPNALIYTSTNYISNGDNRKVAIEKLDIQVKLNADNIASNLGLININIAAIAVNTRTITSLPSLEVSNEILLSTTVSNQTYKLKSLAGAVALSSTPFGSVEPADGTVIVLIGQNDTDYPTIVFNDVDYGCLLNGNADLKRAISLTLTYDKPVKRYIELSRNF